MLGQLTGQAEVEPAQAQFLASDAFAGGRVALDARARAIRQIGDAVNEAHNAAPPRAPLPDLPAWAVIGAAQWLIVQRMRQGEQRLGALAEELGHWAQCYERPIGKHRWSSASPGALPHPSGPICSLIDDPPAHLLDRAAHSSLSEQAHSRRARILEATAASAIGTGYMETTVAAIAAQARINKRDFYRHFRHKREAFVALHELGFQRTMAAGAIAYFSVKHWPERVWRCLLTTSEFLAARPTFAHVGLVETHALGAGAIQRVEESRNAFTTLLRGDRQSTSSLPSVTATEAIGAVIFEIAHDLVLHGRTGELPRHTYQATYLALAPFLGVEAANRFVQRKLEDARRHSGS